MHKDIKVVVYCEGEVVVQHLYGHPSVYRLIKFICNLFKVPYTITENNENLRNS